MSSKRRIYEKTLAENVELQTQLRTCHMDIEGLKREMHRVRTSLYSLFTLGVIQVLRNALGWGVKFPGKKRY